MEISTIVTYLISWLGRQELTLEGLVIAVMTAVVLWKMRDHRKTFANFSLRIASVLQLVGFKTGIHLKFTDLFTSKMLTSNMIANSPLILSKRGIKVGLKLSAKETAENIVPELLKRISKKPTHHEVQTVCFNFAILELLDHIGQDVKLKIDEAIRKDGGHDENTLMVYGIMFRDEALKKLKI